MNYIPYRIIGELPKCTQQLLVLLFGTFRAVSLSSGGLPSSGIGMSSEALGVSVAPSFFHTCVGAGRQATMDDVIRFKVKFIKNSTIDVSFQLCVQFDNALKFRFLVVELK